MTSDAALRLPRLPLLLAWVLLTVCAYYLMWFTPWGEYAVASSPVHTFVVEATIVLASVCCLEVLRTEKLMPLRALAGAVGFPLVLVTLWTLWYGVRSHLLAR